MATAQYDGFNCEIKDNSIVSVTNLLIKKTTAPRTIWCKEPVTGEVFSLPGLDLARARAIAKRLPPDVVDIQNRHNMSSVVIQDVILGYNMHGHLKMWSVGSVSRSFDEERSPDLQPVGLSLSESGPFHSLPIEESKMTDVFGDDFTWRTGDEELEPFPTF